MSKNVKINTEVEYIINMLTHFKLIDIKENYQELINQAINENLGYKEFLLQLINTEAAEPSLLSP